MEYFGIGNGLGTNFVIKNKPSQAKPAAIIILINPRIASGADSLPF
jgi:hypothetical protein